MVTFDRCQKFNHVLMGAGAPRHGDLLPTGRTEPEIRFSGAAPIGGTKSNPTYYDDEFKATVLEEASSVSLIHVLTRSGREQASARQCPTIETRIFDAV